MTCFSRVVTEVSNICCSEYMSLYFFSCRLCLAIVYCNCSTFEIKETTTRANTFQPSCSRTNNLN